MTGKILIRSHGIFYVSIPVSLEMEKAVPVDKLLLTGTLKIRRNCVAGATTRGGNEEVQEHLPKAFLRRRCVTRVAYLKFLRGAFHEPRRN